MKYIIHVVRIDTDKFTYQIESIRQYAQDSAGMASGSATTGFFSAKDEAISSARRSLQKAGIKDEDIIVQ